MIDYDEMLNKYRRKRCSSSNIKPFYPVVKSTGIDVMLRTPLIITGTVAAAFHNKPVLLFGSASLSFHTNISIIIVKRLQANSI